MKIRYFCFTLLTLLAGCSEPQPTTAPPRPALVMVVNADTDASGMILVGEVRPRYESIQGFRIGGKIIERHAEVGDVVKKGQALAKLDPTDTMLSAAAAQAEVRSAQANLALATAEVGRYRELAAKNFVSRSALDAKEAELKNANAALKEAVARADVSANQAKYTRLIADRDGIVTLIHAEPGQVVEAGDTVAQIADTQHIDAVVAVPESRISEAQVNAPVTLKLWADNNSTYPGVVREIAPSADPNTRIFNVRITVTQTDSALRLGMTARVKFSPPNGVQATGVLVPSAALTEINGNKTVWVIDNNNKAQPRIVSAGPFTEQGVLITDGLESGEKIAVAGVHTLLKDQQVKPVLETSP